MFPDLCKYSIREATRKPWLAGIKAMMATGLDSINLSELTASYVITQKDPLRICMKMEPPLLWSMEVTLIYWKVGSGIKVSYGSGSWSWVYAQGLSLPVSGKQELMFDRTSP